MGQKQKTCAWCGEAKTYAEMRFPGSSKGKIPQTCQQCRESNPVLSWCEGHGKPHSVREFGLYGKGRPGYVRSCATWYMESRSAAQNRPDRTCSACTSMRPAWQFSGGVHKRKVCRDCIAANPGLNFCVDCSTWLPLSEFHVPPNGRASRGTRCRDCAQAHRHGTTVAAVLALQGSTRRECAVCKATDNLKIDHDHSCCPHISCGTCVRGYLCGSCNNAEGLLRSAKAAAALAEYLRRSEERRMSWGRTAPDTSSTK